MFNATAKQYAEHWATLTGRRPQEVYVPAALRVLETGQRVHISAGPFTGHYGTVQVIARFGAIVGIEGIGARTVVALDQEGARWKRC